MVIFIHSFINVAKNVIIYILSHPLFWVYQFMIVPYLFASPPTHSNYSCHQDEDVYTFFEPELPSDTLGMARTKGTDGLKLTGERRPSINVPLNRNGSKSPHNKGRSSSEKKTSNHNCANGRKPSPEKIQWNVLDLKAENYFSCAVGRSRTNARYLLGSSDDVVTFLKKLVGANAFS